MKKELKAQFTMWLKAQFAIFSMSSLLWGQNQLLFVDHTCICYLWLKTIRPGILFSVIIFWNIKCINKFIWLIEVSRQLLLFSPFGFQETLESRRCCGDLLKTLLLYPVPAINNSYQHAHIIPLTWAKTKHTYTNRAETAVLPHWQRDTYGKVIWLIQKDKKKTIQFKIWIIRNKKVVALNGKFV